MFVNNDLQTEHGLFTA